MVRDLLFLERKLDLPRDLQNMPSTALMKLRLLKASLVLHTCITSAFALLELKKPAQNVAQRLRSTDVLPISTMTSSFLCCRSSRSRTNVPPNTTINSTRTRRTTENCTSSSCQCARRRCIISAWSLMSAACWSSSPPLTTPRSQAAETIGKDENCNDSSCLGVWDGLLADCPHGQQNFLSLTGIGGGTTAGCTSSQDDTPGIFAEPWDYSENVDLNWEQQMNNLVSTIEQVAAKRGDTVRIILQQGRYLRVVFQDGNSGEASVGEFYFTPNDTTVQFRVASLRQQKGSGVAGVDLLLSSTSQKNMERAESIRRELSFLKLPVLRNRKRSLFFVESNFDTFGPGSAMLGPPAEMATGDLQGRQDMDKTGRKSDTVQTSPFR
jgi:Protein of unknown function (DUF1499)